MTTSLTDRDFTEKLIEEVKSHPTLYNIWESNYHDRYKVEREWQAVASRMGCTADAAKKRWQNLRGSYSRSRCDQNLPSGSGVPGKKKPQFYLAQQMNFLEPYMQNGSTQGDLGSFKSEPLWEDGALTSGSQDAMDQTTPSSTAERLRMTISVSDRDFTEKLIEEVKRHPTLYNARESGYKDRFMVEREWQAVASCMGCPADAAKKRWQNLRGSYSRSRCNQNLPSGSGVPGKRKPQFYLAQQMSFLEPYMQNGNMQSDLGSSEPELQWEEGASGSGSQDGLDQTTFSTSSPPLSPRADEPKPESEPRIPFITPTTPISVKLRKRAAPVMDNDDFFKEKAVRFLEAKMEHHENNYKEELESLRGLLPHMATLSRRRKRTYLRKIYDLLFEMMEEEENEIASMADVYA